MKSDLKTISSEAALAVLLLLTGAATPALAAVPELINFQGKLTDSAGTAITSSVPMVFKFYADASGGSPLWTETQNVTPDSSGIYSVMLGIVTPFGIPFSNAYWLGVTVGTDSEMLPRYRVVSSAYSLYSLNSATAAYSVNSGTAAWAQGADWASITNKLAAGAASDGYLTSIDWNIFNGKLSASGDGSALTGLTAGQVGLGSVANTSDADKPVSTLQQAALNLKANLAGATFSGAIFANNLSGTNTGDQTAVSGNAGTVTNGVYTAGDQTIGGIKTFSSAIVGSVSGNAGTVTTNANLTGVVTSAGNATSIANGAITNAMLFNGAVANLSGTNTGDQTAVSGNAGTVTNGVYIVGDQTIGGIKTFSSAIVGSVSGNAGTVTTNANLTGDVTSIGNATTLTNAAVIAKVLTSYVSGAGVVAATDSILQAIQKLNGNIEANTGDVLKAANQTFTGLNTFTSPVTAKGFVNAVQSVSLGGVSTFAADGSGVVLLTQAAGSNPIGTITGCDSGVVGQGQLVTFVAVEWAAGTLTFLDTTVGTALADTLVLNGDSITWAPSADPASRGYTITLLCTTISTTGVPVGPKKLWVEVGRSRSNI